MFESWRAGSESCPWKVNRPVLRSNSCRTGPSACPTCWAGRNREPKVGINRLSYHITSQIHSQNSIAKGIIALLEYPRELFAGSGETRRREKAKADATVSAQESTSFAGFGQGVPWASRRPNDNTSLRGSKRPREDPVRPRPIAYRRPANASTGSSPCCPGLGRPKRQSFPYLLQGLLLEWRAQT